MVWRDDSGDQPELSAQSTLGKSKPRYTEAAAENLQKLKQFA